MTIVVVVINWCCLFVNYNDDFLLVFAFVVVAFVSYFLFRLLFATIIIRYFSYFSLSQTHVAIVKRNIGCCCVCYAMPVVVSIVVGLVDAAADECALILMAFYNMMPCAVLCCEVTRCVVMRVPTPKTPRNIFRIVTKDVPPKGE